MGYYWDNAKTTRGITGNDAYHDKGTYSEFGLGFAYFASRHVAIELVGSLSKNYMNDVSWKKDSYGDHFNLSAGVQVFIGKGAE